MSTHSLVAFTNSSPSSSRIEKSRMNEKRVGVWGHVRTVTTWKCEGMRTISSFVRTTAQNTPCFIMSSRPMPMSLAWTVATSWKMSSIDLGCMRPQLSKSIHLRR